MCDPIKTVKDSISIAGEVMKIAGDNPDVKQAGQTLGKTALTITKAINNALLPLAAVNFAFDKARVYFSKQFQIDLSTKASKIAPEDIVVPKASIAGPTLQGLAFSHDELNLKDMYLSLLATAMNKETSNDAHPAFVEIIKQLSPEEAVLLKDLDILSSELPMAVAEIQLVFEDNSQWKTLQTHLLPLEDRTSHRPKEHPRATAMVDNWIRLGLVEVDYDHKIGGEENYEWVASRPEFIRYKLQLQHEGQKVAYIRGTMVRTEFGHQFSHAVGLIN